MRKLREVPKNVEYLTQLTLRLGKDNIPTCILEDIQFIQVYISQFAL